MVLAVPELLHIQNAVRKDSDSSLMVAVCDTVEQVSAGGRMVLERKTYYHPLCHELLYS